jgi:hypothetical protein
MVVNADIVEILFIVPLGLLAMMLIVEERGGELNLKSSMTELSNWEALDEFFKIVRFKNTLRWVCDCPEGNILPLAIDCYQCKKHAHGNSAKRHFPKQNTPL